MKNAAPGVSLILLGILFAVMPVRAQRIPPVDVIAIKLDNSFDPTSANKLDEAIALLAQTLNSEEFAREVLHARFRIAAHKKNSVDIYKLIVTGMNNYEGASEDLEVALKVKLFDEFVGHGNFGITDMDTRETRTHRCYVLKNDVTCYASHLAHEYMHQVGFIDKKRFILFGTKTRSVPYVIGDIVHKLLGNTSECEAIDENCTIQPISMAR